MDVSSVKTEERDSILVVESTGFLRLEVVQ